MPLAQVATIVAIPGPLAAERLISYWDGFERRVARQRELVAHIRSKLSGAESSVAFTEIQQREVSVQLVLTEQRHLQVEQLPAWIGASMGRLMDSAQRHGGVVGHPFVVYYGEVNEDSDGPAEPRDGAAVARRRLGGRANQEILDAIPLAGPVVLERCAQPGPQQLAGNAVFLVRSRGRRPALPFRPARCGPWERSRSQAAFFEVTSRIDRSRPLRAKGDPAAWGTGFGHYRCCCGCCAVVEDAGLALRSSTSRWKSASSR